jgi:uncharacterized protein YfaS (alpha-2-macroglobulin family)
MEQLRRRGLLAGLVSLGAGAAAGCSEDDSGQVRIEQFRFLDADPPRYDEYAGVTADSFRPGDQVRLYLDPAGVSLAAGEEGTETYDLTARVTVRDPDGEPIDGGTDVSLSATGTADEVDELYLLPTVSLGVRAAPGTYTAEVDLVDEHSGVSVTQTGQFSVTDPSPGQLAVDRAVFVTEPASGYRQYEQVQTPTYERGQTVPLYIEPRGVEPATGASQSFAYELELSMLVTPPDGADIDAKSLTFSGSVDDFDALLELFFNVSYELPTDAPAGEYQLRLDLTDRTAEASVSETVSFLVA